ncbi:hypothetical protein [Mucilaginibacter sp.]|uniref:HU domain-containing protein n=1 Tax=Mucilaginibacter sp. TaxID=1882438 RepID=UPI00285228F2|nr:hypothetical protein [Mucilaginibacter sp.]MDR3694317.1 hypothetical protein [Mucilaginibacter sp.]
MNLADYLSELLGQQDEVSVPGLGYFVRLRIKAYYSDSEGRFYPPHHQIKFVPEIKEDDTFAQYVADNKNISLASSKYFVEKFISKLKEDAARGKYLFADLGSFFTEQGQLVFKPNDRIPADPAFYGYPPVDIPKIGAPVSADTKKPAFNQTQSVTSPPAPPAEVSTAYVKPVPQPQYYEEDVEPKKTISVWLIVLITVAVLALAVFGFYKFYPSAFDKVKDTFNKITGKTAVIAPAVKPMVKPDTGKKTVVLTDTNKKKTVAPIDTVKPSRFEAVADKVIHLEKANERVKYLKSMGLNAYIILDAPGPLIKVSVGSFKTYNEADSLINALLITGRINKNWRHQPLEVKTQLK